MFSKLKTYALVIAATVGSVLLIAVRVLFGQNQKLRTENKTVKAQKKHLKKVMEQDTAIDEQADVHLAEVAKEVEDGKPPSELLDPNRMWNDKSSE